MSAQRGRRDHQNRKHDGDRGCHSRDHVDPHAEDLRRSDPPDGARTIRPFLDLFAALPEHQVWRDGRSKDGHQAGEVVLAGADVRNRQVSGHRGPVHVDDGQNRDVGKQ